MGEVTGTENSLWHYENEARKNGRKNIAGVDEAGRGPLAGPVVAAAVILPPDFDLTDIRDSKTLTPSRREKAYKRIVDEASAVGVGIVGPDEIDEINILQASFKAMRAALIDMGAAFDYVLVDGNLTIPDIETEQLAIIEGDTKSASIAAASIVAKVTRDCIMIELAEKYPDYGFEKHKGYCTKEHLEALRKHGVCEIHRRSFSPVKGKAEEDCPQKSLF